MRITLIDGGQGIAAIDSLADLTQAEIEILRQHTPENVKVEDLALFYVPGRDLIVINNSHKMSGYYTDIIRTYFSLSEQSRQEAKEESPTQETREAFEIMDYVIDRRKELYAN